MPTLFSSILFYQLLVLAVCFVIMSIAWIFSERYKNAGVVDIIWAISFGICATSFAFALPDLNLRRCIFLTLCILWSGRLTYYLFKRFRHEWPVEDKRYRAIRESWQSREKLGIFLVFQFQALLIAVLSVPFIAVNLDSRSDLTITDYIGCLLMFTGIVGEAEADEQLKKFKADPANAGKTCSIGLWNYSRHPNYFFEWLVWVGIYLFACQSQASFYCLISPLLMLFMLTKVSGISLAEKYSRADRGEEFRLYQESTSAFFPWFKIRKEP